MKFNISNSISYLNSSQINKSLSSQCELLVRSLYHYRQYINKSANVNDIQHNDDLIKHLVAIYMNSIEKNKVIFADITDHHKQLQILDEWMSPTDTTIENRLQKYASAAEMMGLKPWVREGNEWMLNYAYNYFCRNGARRAYVKDVIDRRLRDVSFLTSSSLKSPQGSINRSEEKSSVEKKPIQLSQLRSQLSDEISVSLTANLMDDGNTISNDSSIYQNPNYVKSNRKIRLLDVGSCYNPFVTMDRYDAFDVTAIDLYPASSSVMKCDFLNVTIGDKESKPVINRTAIHNEVLQLPAESYDVVTMSLVLSYLPTPELRLKMIQNARKLLVSSGYRKDYPHHTGLLLIVEKPSIFTSDTLNQFNHATLLHNWKQAIQDCGFQLLKYCQLSPGLVPNVTGSRRSHLFAFRVIPTSQSDKNTDHNQIKGNRSSYALWIKQDFNLNKTVKIEDHESSQESVTNSKQLDSMPTYSTETNIMNPNENLNKKFEFSISASSNDLSTNQLPIAIIGGGIGGTALGLLLKQRKMPVKVYEKDSSFHSRKQGYALTLQQAATTLRAIGLREDICHTGVRSYAHQSMLWNGQTIGCYGPLVRDGKVLEDEYTKWPDVKFIKYSDSSDPIMIEKYVNDILSRKYSRHNIHIPRQTLREIMYDQIKDENIIEWNKKLIHYEESKDMKHVDLYFDDNQVIRAGLVVAADGIYSTIRKQMLKVKDSDLNYLGLMVILGISPDHQKVDALENNKRSVTSFVSIGKYLRKQVQWVNGQTRVFSMPYNETHTMWQLSFPISESKASELQLSGSNALKYEALNRINGWDERLVALIKSTDSTMISGHPSYDRDPITLEEMSTYRDIKSRTTYLGDSLHPMSPFKGQGANQALVDALSLAKFITSSDYIVPKRRKVSESLRLYEEDMLSRSAQKVLRSRESAVYLHSDFALTHGNFTRAMAAETAYKRDIDHESNAILSSFVKSN